MRPGLRWLLLTAVGLIGCPSPAPPDDDDAAADDDDDDANDDDSADDDDDSAPTEVPITDRMLVIYNADEPDSLAVAEHYLAARDLPDSALCPTTPGAIDAIDASVYSAGVGQPVLDCIDGEWERYLVFVTVWGMPYRVTGAARDIADSSNIVPASLDALLTAPYRQGDLPVSPIYSPYFRATDSMGGIYEEGVPIAQWRAEGGANFYLVTRLDGATPADAMRLVDDAIAAETTHLTGLAYVDRGWQVRDDTDAFGSYQSVEWELTRLVEVFEAAGFATVYDENDAEIGTAPAPLAGTDALYYGGWYSFNNYNDVWDWNFGSISLHFDSCSACDPRGGPNWSANVLQRGAVATMGAVAEPYVAGLMGYDQFYRFLFQGYSFAEAGYMATPVAEWMATFLGDPLYRPYGAAPLLPEGWQPDP